MALERTLVTMDYEDKRKSKCTAPDKMLFRVKIIVVTSCVAKKKKKKTTTTKKIRVLTNVDSQR